MNERAESTREGKSPQVDVRDALLAYLKTSKRLSVLHANGPLWTRAGEPDLPLTSRSYANNLKKYAAKAGMRRVNVHQTRHTYARIIFEDSGDLLEMQSALDHENQATTRVYVPTVAVKRGKYSGRIASRTNETPGTRLRVRLRISAKRLTNSGQSSAERTRKATESEVEALLPKLKERLMLELVGFLGDSLAE